MWVEEVPGTFSPVYWGRYVDWVLTTPLMLWDILALAGAPNDEIAMVVIMDMLMIGLDAPELKPQTKTSGFSSFLAWSLSSTSALFSSNTAKSTSTEKKHVLFTTKSLG